jgi:hypothetical protein
MFDSTINMTSDTARINVYGGIYLAGKALPLPAKIRIRLQHNHNYFYYLVSNSVRSEIRTDFRSPDETNNQPLFFSHVRMSTTIAHNNNDHQRKRGECD